MCRGVSLRGAHRAGCHDTGGESALRHGMLWDILRRHHWQRFEFHFVFFFLFWYNASENFRFGQIKMKFSAFLFWYNASENLRFGQIKMKFSAFLFCFPFLVQCQWKLPIRPDQNENFCFLFFKFWEKISSCFGRNAWLDPPDVGRRDETRPDWGTGDPLPRHVRPGLGECHDRCRGLSFYSQLLKVEFVQEIEYRLQSTLPHVLGHVTRFLSKRLILQQSCHESEHSAPLQSTISFLLFSTRKFSNNPLQST